MISLKKVSFTNSHLKMPKKQFVSGGWAANYQIAGYIGMTPFEVKILPDNVSGGKKFVRFV